MNHKPACRQTGTQRTQRINLVPLVVKKQSRNEIDMIQKLLYLTLLLAVSTSLSAQDDAAINPDYLPGKWQIDVNATLEAIPDHKRSEYNGKTDEQKAGIANSLASRQFHFEVNGGYKMVIVNRAQYPGTWQLQGTQIHVSLDAGESFSSSIIELTDSQLVLRVVEDTQSAEMFHLLHLTLIER